MTKKELREVIIAMMHTAGFDPLIDDDYYQSIDASSIIRFLEGIVSYFNLPRDSWMVHFGNLGYLDTPSETIGFFQQQADVLISIKNGEELK